MQKIAGKPSGDPKNQKLRDDKKVWNKSVSLFIDDLIECKKLMNGHSNKFFNEKSTIKNPIPADPNTILGALLLEFQRLIQEANSIVQQQIEYSKNRRKSKKELNHNPNQLELALSAYNYDNFVKTSSNSLTRFFSQLKNPFSSGIHSRNKTYRLNFLKFLVELEKDFKNLQIEILNNGPESIFTSSKILYKIKLNLQSFSKLVQIYSKSVDYKEKSDDKDDKVIDIYNDITKNKDSFDFELILFEDLINKIEVYKTLTINSEKEDALNKIVHDYHLMIADANRKSGTHENSLSNILLKKSNLITEASISNWLKRKKHQLNPFDKTTAIRLDIDKEIELCKKNIDNCMNSLEKEIDLHKINNTILELGDSLEKITNFLSPLQVSLKGQLFDDTYLKMLNRKNLTDYDVSLDNKQEEELKKLLNRKKLRDMLNMYSEK